MKKAVANILFAFIREALITSTLQIFFARRLQALRVKTKMARFRRKP